MEVVIPRATTFTIDDNVGFGVSSRSKSVHAVSVFLSMLYSILKNMNTLGIVHHPLFLLWESIMCMYPVKETDRTSCKPNDVVQIPLKDKKLSYIH